MKKWQLLFFVLTSLVFSGCSYQNYFILGNSSNAAIIINYTIDQGTNRDHIFEDKGEIYPSTHDNFPDWAHPLPFQDLNNSDTIVSVKLNPKNTLVFGTLQNDKYDIHTMRTASGKGFNLTEMSFTINGVDFNISKGNFHQFFVKDGGTFKFVIQ